MIDLADTQARYIAILQRRTIRMLERELAPLQLGPGRYLYLFALYIEDGRSQQSLANAVSADKAAATRALTRLESDGYVQRTPCVGDRRIIRVHLTPRGRMLREVLERAATRANDTLLATLSTDDRERLRVMLRAMTRATSDG